MSRPNLTREQLTARAEALEFDERLDNMKHAYRHAQHALEDFQAVRPKLKLPQLAMGSGKETVKLLHSLSHHLRHVVYRLGRVHR